MVSCTCHDTVSGYWTRKNLSSASTFFVGAERFLTSFGMTVGSGVTVDYGMTVGFEVTVDYGVTVGFEVTVDHGVTVGYGITVDHRMTVGYGVSAGCGHGYDSR